MTIISAPSAIAFQPGDAQPRSNEREFSLHFDSVMQPMGPPAVQTVQSYRPAPEQEALELPDQDKALAERNAAYGDTFSMVPLLQWGHGTLPDAVTSFALSHDGDARNPSVESVAPQGTYAGTISFPLSNARGPAGVTETEKQEVCAITVNAGEGHSNGRAFGISLSSISIETFHQTRRQPEKLEASLQQIEGPARVRSNAAGEAMAQPQPADASEGAQPFALAAVSEVPMGTRERGPQREPATHPAASPASIVVDGIVRSFPAPTQSNAGGAFPAVTAGLAPSDALPMAGLSGAGEAVKRLRVKLHPAQLGEVDVCIVMKGANLNIQLRAETLEAKHALQSSHFEILEALSDQGLRLENLLVELAAPLKVPDAAILSSVPDQPHRHHSAPDHQQRGGHRDDSHERPLRGSSPVRASDGLVLSGKQGVFV